MALSRRALLATGTATGLTTALPNIARAQAVSHSLSPGTEMRQSAVALLAVLDAAQTAVAQVPFTARAREDWSYMLGSRRAPGLALEQMRAPQKEAALDLLATALSAEGFTKARNIMLQQDILRDEWGKGSPDRNRERFSVRIFGTPSDTGPWGWRWEGHHLTLSVTLVGERVVSITPNAFSSEPNSVPSGPHRGLVVLEAEERDGRRLFADLAGSARRTAQLPARALGNVRAIAGREDMYGDDRAGLALADMTQAQRDLATRLIEVYTVDPFAGPLAEAQRARIREGDLDAAHFAFVAEDRPDGMVYYRLHGASFLIEFATLQNQPQHQHTVVHDTDRTLGRHAL